MDKRSKELLNWAVQNSESSQEASKPVTTSRLDPGVIDAILGPDDSTLMVESMKAIKDTSLSLDDRAFDNLEMLVEQIDNASNLDNLKLWPPLLSMLNSPDAELRRYAAWVIGTAVQNNPKAQGHFFQYKGLKRLVDKLDDEYPVRSKVLYALGSQLHHFPAGVRQFNEAGGWEKLRKCVDPVDEGIECQRRTAFFVSNYLADENVATQGLGDNKFLEGFVDILGNERYTEQPDLQEKVQSHERVVLTIKALQAASMMVSRDLGTSDKESLTKLKQLLPSLKEKHPESLDQSQWTSLENSLDTL